MENPSRHLAVNQVNEHEFCVGLSLINKHKKKMIIKYIHYIRLDNMGLHAIKAHVAVVACMLTNCY